MKRIKIKGKLPEGKERLKILKKIDEYFSNAEETEEKITILKNKKKQKKIIIQENKKNTKILYQEKTLFKNKKIEYTIKTKEINPFKEFLKQHNYKEKKEHSYYKITYTNKNENSIIDENTILTLKLNTEIKDIFEITSTKTIEKTKKEKNITEEDIKRHLKTTISFLGLKEDKNTEKESKKAELDF